MTVLNSDCVELSAVDTEPHGTVLFGTNTTGLAHSVVGGSITADRGILSINVSIFPCGWSGVVRRLVIRARPSLELDGMRCGLDLT